jgi:hypothetical protein
MVGAPTCNIRKLRVFFVKRWRTARVDRYMAGLTWGAGWSGPLIIDRTAVGDGKRRGSLEESQGWPPGLEFEHGESQREEGNKGNSPRGSQRRERRRERRSTPAACRGAPGSGGDRAVHAEGASEGEVRVEADLRVPYIGRRVKGRRWLRRWGGFRRWPPLMPGGGSVRRWREGRRDGAWVHRCALKVARCGGEGAQERERAWRPGRRAVVADDQGRGWERRR